MRRVLNILDETAPDTEEKVETWMQEVQPGEASKETVSLVTDLAGLATQDTHKHVDTLLATKEATYPTEEATHSKPAID